MLRPGIVAVVLLAACSSRSAPAGDGGGDRSRSDQTIRVELGLDWVSLPEMKLDAPYAKSCPAAPTEGAGCPKGCSWVVGVPTYGPPFLCAQACSTACPTGQACSGGYCMGTCTDDGQCGGMWNTFFWCDKTRQVCTWGTRPDAGADRSAADRQG